jgi:protein-disulfide isomerase
MKRQYVVLAAIVGLAGAFMLAAHVYTSQESDRIAALAAAADSPLERPHSRGLGPADAKVVLVEHPDRVRLVLRYAPLHQGSDTMVKILEAAALQDRFWETLQVMYATQPQWASHHHPQPEKIWEFLPRAGVDVDLVRRDMQDLSFVQIIEQDLADGRTLGVRKTPQFFVNGQPLVRFGHQQLKSMLDAEVAKQYPE